MKLTIPKHIFLSLLILMPGIPAISQLRPLEKRRHSVNKLLDRVMAEADFKTAGFGFYAIDIQSGEVIAQRNPDRALRPASTLKLFSIIVSPLIYPLN